MRERSHELEYIDLGPSFYSEEEYADCLKKLGRIGRLLGGDRASLSVLSQVCKQPCTLLDVGCGGGDFAWRVAKQFPHCEVTGIDTSKDAIAYAKKKQLPNLRFEHREEAELNDPSNSYDVVMATLMCHHLSDDQIVDFLKRANQVAKKCVLINDLHRHPLAYGSFAVIAPIFFRNRLIWHDGLLSVKRGFSRNELVRYCALAGIKEYTVEWKWAFRWVVTIKSI